MMAAKKPNLNDMRLYILNKYPGMKWKERVYTMKPSQVAAIYKNVKQREALEKLNLFPGVFSLPKNEEFHQIDMFEYLLSMKGEE